MTSIILLYYNLIGSERVMQRNHRGRATRSVMNGFNKDYG